MKKLKLILTLLVIAAMLPSCKSRDNSSETNNSSKPDTKPVVLAEGEEIIDVKCTIDTSTDTINNTCLRGTFFKTYQEWQDAAKDCTLETVRSVSDNYDEDFFKSHSLCYYSRLASGGMEYEFRNATLKSSGNKNILTIYTTCNTEHLCDCSELYDFFIETDKNIDSIDQVIIME